MKTISTILLVLAGSVLLGGCLGSGTNVQTGTNVGTLRTSTDPQVPIYIRTDAGQALYADNINQYSSTLNPNDRIIFNYTLDWGKPMVGGMQVITINNLDVVLTHPVTSASKEHIDSAASEAVSNFDLWTAYEFISIQYMYPHGKGESKPVLYRDTSSTSDTITLYLKQTSTSTSGDDKADIHSFNLGLSLDQYSKGDSVRYILYYDKVSGSSSVRESVKGTYTVFR